MGRGKLVIMLILGIMTGIMLMFILYIGWGNKFQDKFQDKFQHKETGRYQLLIHVIQGADIIMVDTKTGTTKVVAYAGPEGVAGHQFGIPFEQMEALPKAIK